MKTHREMIDEWMEDPDFVAEYDALADEFALFDEMLRARKKNFSKLLDGVWVQQTIF